MSEESLSDTGDTLSLSRLDVISCALGAAVLLFLVLSVVRSQPPIKASVQSFIDIKLVVNDDPRAVMNFVVRPPGATKDIDLPIKAFNRHTGHFNAETGRLIGIGDDLKLLNKAAKEFTLLGFSQAGDIRTYYQNATHRRIYKLRVHQPTPGRWTIKARYMNRNDGAFGSKYPKPIAIEATCVTHKQRFATKNVIVKYNEASDSLVPDLVIEEPPPGRK